MIDTSLSSSPVSISPTTESGILTMFIESLIIAGKPSLALTPFVSISLLTIPITLSSSSDSIKQISNTVGKPSVTSVSFFSSSLFTKPTAVSVHIFKFPHHL